MAWVNTPDGTTVWQDDNLIKQIQSLSSQISSQNNEIKNLQNQPKVTANDQLGLTGLSAGLRYDAQGRPIRNDYSSILDSNGNLLDKFSQSNKIGDDVNLNQDAYNAIKQRALSSNPSQWAQLALDKQNQEQQNSLDSANRNSSTASNQMLNQMRMNGGMSAGARERIARQGMRDLMNANQNVQNQGVLNRANIMMQDQQTKDNMLAQIPGMDLQQANFQQGQRDYRNQAMRNDMGNMLNDVRGYNAYQADAFGKAMQEWSAAKTADAQAAASSSRGGKK